MGTLQDLRYAARAIRRQPSFTAVAVFTLAVGIGANTAIYSVLDATLIRPLPFHNPERLMSVSLIMPPRWGRPADDQMVWSYPKYETFRQLQQVFSTLALYRAGTVNVTGGGEAERLRSATVGADYFRLLGVEAEVGRTFLPEEDSVPQRDLVAVIGHELWSRRFGADAGIVGKPITLDQKNYTIVGVIPAGFQGLSGPAEVWIPVHARAGIDLGRPQSHSWLLAARRKPEISVEQAKAAVAVLGARIDAAYPDLSCRGWGAIARSLDETRIDPAIRKSVLVLFGAVSFVLLIACVNVANLLLARGTSRQREIAIRLAIGAVRGRLIRQLLTESLLLSILGGVASVAVTYAGVKALGALNLGGDGSFTFHHGLSGLTLLGFGSIRLDFRALLFTSICSLTSVGLFGLAPAVQASRASLAETLRGGKPRGIAGLHLLTGKSVLIVAEVALAVVLLNGAGVMIKSLGKLTAIPFGADAENVLTARLTPSGPARTAGPFFDELEARISALPGVISVASSDNHPLSGGSSNTLISFPDHPPVPTESRPLVSEIWVSPDYFKTFKIPLLHGRLFTRADSGDAPRVVLVSETAARRFWPGQDPLGKPVGIGLEGYSRAEVVGVVGDVRYGRIGEPAKPTMYLAVAQSPLGSRALVVRTNRDPRAFVQALRQQVRTLNGNVPVYDVKTMKARVHAAGSNTRFNAVLLGVFAAVALVLAATGIYGVMSYLVTHRTREMGIRIALGAPRWTVISLVLRRGGALALAGVALGLGGSVLATRALTALLYGVKSADLETYCLMTVAAILTALLASYIPAWRASSVDPACALRCE